MRTEGLKDVPAVYAIKHVATGRVYIGSTGKALCRARQHRSLLKLNKHFCPHLQHAWNKYGAEAFVFEVLEECAGFTERALREREADALMRARPLTFNTRDVEITEHAAGRRFGKEARSAMSRAQRGKKISAEHQRALSEGYVRAFKEGRFAGRFWLHSKEAREKAGNRLRGRPLSAAHKAAIGAGRGKRVALIDGVLSLEFPSARAASQHFGERAPWTGCTSAIREGYRFHGFTPRYL